MTHHLWLDIYDSSFMTHHLWLIIYDSLFMTHHLWLIIFDLKFYKNVQKIEQALESEESHYVMWCNGLGLANLVELSQKHARKCKETCVPLLNGFKVGYFQGSPDTISVNF